MYSIGAINENKRLFEIGTKAGHRVKVGTFFTVPTRSQHLTGDTYLKIGTVPP